jgi:hypothetical protein
VPLQWLATQLPVFQARGDRVLLFSQFTTLLDIIEQMLAAMGYQYLRLDGQTPVPDRLALIDEFVLKRQVHFTKFFVYLQHTSFSPFNVQIQSRSVHFRFSVVDTCGWSWHQSHGGQRSRPIRLLLQPF